MPRRLVKKRKVDREPPSDVRTRRTSKRPKRKKFLVDEVVGDVIVVDTGNFEDPRTSGGTEITGETGTAGDKGTVEDNSIVEDVSPKRTSASVGSDAAQKARDALLVLDSGPGFAEKQRNWLQNNKSLDVPSPDGEGEQSRITRPSTITYQSDSATRRSSSLANLHNAEWPSPPRDSPNDCQRLPKLARLSSSSQEQSPLAIPCLEQSQPNSSSLQVRYTEHSASESSSPLMRIDKPPLSKLMAEGDHCLPNFGISRASTGRQASQPATIDNPPPHPAGVLYLGTARNDELSTQSHTRGSDLPDDPQAFQLPSQASRENIGAGGLWTGALTSHHDRPAQHLRKLRPDSGNKLQQSSTGIISTNTSICQATRLVRQPLLEQNPHTSFPVSNFPGPALSLSPNPSNFAGPLPVASLENIRSAADHPLPATAVARTHYRPLDPCPPPSTPDTEIATPQERSTPAQVNCVSRQPLQLIKDSFPYHHNSVWMNVITGVFETSRTVNDKKMLRGRAAKMIAGREDVELEEEETTGGRNRVYPDACGLVVDKSSAKGLVAITDQGFSVQQVDTGQGLMGEPYAELAIGVGQTCVIHGSSTVLYYKPRKVPASNHAQPSPPRAADQPRESSIREVVKLASSPPEIAIRLQINEVGRFSAPYDFSIWSRKIKTIEFFAWFRRETGRGGVKGPPLLTFTLKDAMSNRKSRDIAILDEDYFRWMRKHVIKQFDKAKLFMPGLKDFTVLVIDPKWVS